MMAADATTRRKSNVASAKSKLSKFHAALESFDDSVRQDGRIPCKDTKPKNWKYAFCGTGSNAFGQLNFDVFDLMSSTLKTMSVENGMSKLKEHQIDTISCGSNTTAALISLSSKSKTSDGFSESVCYLWGEGIGSPQQRVPTPISTVTNVKSISCGQSHCGLITRDGKVYTWGSIDNGMLGHGWPLKHAVIAPKLVTSLSTLCASEISCGAFHTAVIASSPSEISYVHVPGATSEHLLREEDNILICGTLYMFGLGKAGQLGLDELCTGVGKVEGGLGSKKSAGSNTILRDCVAVPTADHGLKVARVSCGFHHTLVIALPIHSTRIFTTSVFSFGWNEHGRLGLGDEERRTIPEMVTFPAPFHAVEISAGEQHSLAAGKQGCYSWGNNSMGQLGVGNPGHLEYSAVPMMVYLPEAMLIKKIGAGGRHSAAVTCCGKILTWGWGEEGQLGHGSERSCYLPRPARLPKIQGKVVKAVSVSLGMSHTVVVVENSQYEPPNYVEETIPEEDEKEQDLQFRPPPLPSPILEKVSPIPPLDIEEKITEEIIEEDIEIVQEPAKPLLPSSRSSMLTQDDDFVMTNHPIRSIKELLLQREERNRISTPPIPEETEEDVVEVEDLTSTEQNDEYNINSVAVIESDQKDEIVVDECPLIDSETNNEEISETMQVTSSCKTDEKYNIYYKPGQDMSSCLIANSARRAEIRRLKKEGASVQKGSKNK